jgi:hypothetical protein
MSGPFTKVGLKQDVTRRYIAAVNVVLRHSDKSVENPRFQLDRVFFHTPSAFSSGSMVIG